MSGETATLNNWCSPEHDCKKLLFYNDGIIISMTSHALTTLSSTTATRLTPLGVHSGIDITIQNVDSSAIVYLGGDGVTTSNYGYKLTPGNAWSVELPGTDELYAITDVNSSKVAILKTGLEYGR